MNILSSLKWCFLLKGPVLSFSGAWQIHLCLHLSSSLYYLNDQYINQSIKRKKDNLIYGQNLATSDLVEQQGCFIVMQIVINVRLLNGPVLGTLTNYFIA